MVGVSASVNLPLHHKVQKFSLAPAYPGGPGKRPENGCGMESETKLIGLSSAALVVLTEYQLVTYGGRDGRTDGQTQSHSIYRASKASGGKKWTTPEILSLQC